MRRWVILAASLVVSGVFLWLALRDVPISEVVAGIQQADFGWVVLSFLGVIGSLAARAVRWRGLLDNRISLINAFHILNITMLLNLLPLRAGEVARTLLATRYNLPIITTATSIVVERLIDVVTVVLMLAFALSRLPSAPAVVGQAALFFGAAALVAFIVMLVFARYPQIAHRVLVALEDRFPPLKRLNGRKRIEEVLDGLRPMTHAGHAAHALGWTVIGWTSSLFTFYALERSLDIQGVDLIIGSLLGVPLVSFGVAIPVSVMAIGPYEGAVRVAGEAVNMSPVAATTLGFLFHGITTLAYAIFGVLGLAALGVSLGDMLQQPSKAPTHD
jgi:uncharacterized membrane protein YbhN (UPF0104 family)